MSRHRNARRPQCLFHPRLVAEIVGGITAESGNAKPFSDHSQRLLQLLVGAEAPCDHTVGGAEGARRVFERRGVRDIIDLPVRGEPLRHSGGE